MPESLKVLYIAAAIVVASVLGLPAPTVALAATLPHALVLSVHATPSALPPNGGQVHVTGAIENATSCQLELLSRQSFPVVYSHNPTTACRNGSYSAFVTIGANPSSIKRTVAFALVARNGYSSFTGQFYVSLGPRLAPAVLSARATPSALPPSGGQVHVTGTVKHATSCQLELLFAPVLPRRLLAQPDHSVPQRQLLSVRGHRCQPERGEAHRRFRPGGAQRALFLHRSVLCLARALLAPAVLSARATPSALGPSGGQVDVTGTVKNAALASSSSCRASPSPSSTRTTRRADAAMAATRRVW